MNGNMPQMGGCNGLPNTEDAVRGCAMRLQRPHHLEGDVAQWYYHETFQDVVKSITEVSVTNLNILRILPWKLSFIWHPERGPILNTQPHLPS
jgi:hypothetical protein